MAEIGATLREARMRAHIDVSEIEAQTKIRAKYLRALENEEWDLLPGPTFVKSFLRTYGQALGLDAKLLVDEYKREWETPSEIERTEIERSKLGGQTVVSSRRRPHAPEPGPSRGYLIALGAVVIVVALLVVGLLSGKGTSSTNNGTAARGSSSSTHTGASHHARHSDGASAPLGALVAVSMEATAPVYVCLLGDGERKRIPGETLQAGEKRGPFHAKLFKLTLGNASVKLYIDGTLRAVPPSPQAIGYSISRAGRRTLAPAQQPTCT